MSRKKPTAAEKRIAAAPASAFRKLTKAELEKLGFSPKSERLIESGRRIARGVKTISKRLFTFKNTDSTPEAIAEAHAEGRIPYKSQQTQEAARKQKVTRERERETRLAGKSLAPLTSKQIDGKVAEFEKQLTKVKRVSPGPHATRPRGYYRVNASTRARMPDLLRKKLAGEWVPDGDWQQLADAMRAAKHPDLARVLKS